ncbi:MAG TPA: hypothetical protein VFC23_13760 [Thermoanaerobaculia bacterium]|nr:hypothetical protein [Thermoanaerobaculia bacterium]
MKNLAKSYYPARCLAGLLPLLLAAATGTLEAQTAPRIEGPILFEPVAPGVFEGDLRQAPKTTAWRAGEPFREVEDMKEQKPGGPQSPGAAEPSFFDAAAAPGGAGPGVATTFSPVSFDGISATGWVPPDAVGDIGPNHYVQAVNISLAIYDRAGNLLVGPSPINALWAGFGGACQNNNNGDPIVRYDRQADRWLVSQFAFSAGFQCIAISRTPDPVAGGWYLYAFPTTGSPDYPKIGVWPDGYYMGTQRGFPGGGLDVYAFDRLKMLSGLPAGAVHFFVPPPSLFLQPSDLDGPAPAAGTPNFFVRQVDGDQFGGSDRLEMFAFSVNWASPASSTFTPLPSLPVAPFNAILCGSNFFGTCVPQPGTATRLETLPAWLMWRLQYRNFGTHETLVTNHTINTGGDHAGIRWYELRRTSGGAWTVFQQGTHSPDTTVHRWMGSAAMDKDGSLALGYSVASSTVFPGIRYAGRLASDPPGTLPVAETPLINGGGAQTGSIRWGNYSTLDLDPVDDCTFWYTAEYYSANSPAGWRTRIASFQLPSCGKVITPPVTTLPHQIAMLVGGLLTDTSLPLNSGFDTSFLYRRHRFLPLWSWELETGIAFTGDAVHSGLLANGELHLVRHLNAPPAKVLPFLLVGAGVGHYSTLGSSSTAPLATLGIGSDFAWTQTVGFRLDVRALWLHDLVNPGWTRNLQVLWGPTFSF